jgi:hypothetical protein
MTKEPDSESTPSAAQDGFERTRAHLVHEVSARASRTGVAVLITVNLIVLFTRPQNDLSLLRILPLSLVLALCALPFSIPRVGELWRGSAAVKGMFLLLALGAAWVPLAHNNAYAYFTLQDLATQFFCYFFPLIVLLRTGRQLRNLSVVIAGMGAYLALYSITHSGHGPGAFLGDENDLCLALIGLLGVPLFLFAHARSQFERLLYMAAVGMMLAGVVISLSRGGFLGMVALFLYLFVRSRAKLWMIGFALLTAVVGALCVPQDYWEEMSTIKNVRHGTAEERTDTWKIATRIWLHPPHIAFGTGMNNARSWMGEFEPAENKSHFGRSLAGRSVHSTLFQLLADLGVAGVLIIGAIVWTAYRGNARADRQLIASARVARRVESRLKLYEDQQGLEHKELQRDVAVPRLRAENAMIDTKSFRQALAQSVRHFKFLSAFSLGLNASWVGVLVAGLFVSVLYYPTIWFLVTASVILQAHALRCRSLLEELCERVEFIEPVGAE